MSDKIDVMIFLFYILQGDEICIKQLNLNIFV